MGGDCRECGKSENRVCSGRVRKDGRANLYYSNSLRSPALVTCARSYITFFPLSLPPSPVAFPPALHFSLCSTLRMESPGHYQQPMSQRSQLFQSSQLPPPPSQLPPPGSLPSLSFARTTLPPLSTLSSARYPPPTYSHPSLSNTAATPLSALSSSSTLPWPSHRSSSRDDQISPPLRHSDSRSKLVDRDERMDPPTSHHQDHSQSSQSVKHEGEDGMPSTSDFVKKLYKCVPPSLHLVPDLDNPHKDARGRLVLARRQLGASRRLLCRQRHERVHKVYPPPHVQTLQFCLLRQATEQV